MRLESDKYISRKSFLRIAATATVVAFVAVWKMMTVNHKNLTEKPKVNRINVLNLGLGIHLYPNFIVVKSASTLKIYSNRCTHAGCKINKEINGELICPCHGSRYDALSGKVIQGPAGLSLHTLPFTTDTQTGEIIINL